MCLHAKNKLLVIYKVYCLERISDISQLTNSHQLHGS